MAAGCGSKQPQGWQACVDRATEVAVDRSNCDNERAQPQSQGYWPHYHWYYYPRGYYWDAPIFGSRVPPGGTYSTQPFASAPLAHTGGSAIGAGVRTGGSVSRGGFGSTASGHATSGS